MFKIPEVIRSKMSSTFLYEEFQDAKQDDALTNLVKSPVQTPFISVLVMTLDE